MPNPDPLFQPPSVSPRPLRLALRSVSAARGMVWVHQALLLLFSRFAAWLLMSAAFLGVTTVLAVVIPVLGPLLQLMALPLLTLGFMLAAQSALRGGPAHVGHFVVALRPGVEEAANSNASHQASRLGGLSRRQRDLLLLLALYGAAAYFSFVLYGWLSGNALGRVQAEMAQGPGRQKEILAIVNDPAVVTANWVLAALTAGISALFWYAPALIHWAGQSVPQALFSSVVALWRSKAAVCLSLLAWLCLGAVVAMGATMLGAATGSARIVTFLLGLIGLVCTAGFYLSVYFGFVDTFEPTPPAEAGAAASPPST